MKTAKETSYSCLGWQSVRILCLTTPAVFGKCVINYITGLGKNQPEIFVVLSLMPGPIVDVRIALFMYVPLSDAGRALISASIMVWKFSTSLASSNEALPSGTWMMLLLSRRYSTLPALISAMAFVRSIADIKAGKVEYRLDKSNIIHVPVGKASFTEADLMDNFQTLMDALNKARPASLKGTYMKSAVLSSTMGPGIRLNTTKISG